VAADGFVSKTLTIARSRNVVRDADRVIANTEPLWAHWLYDRVGVDNQYLTDTTFALLAQPRSARE
jgi:hypothetical protein